MLRHVLWSATAWWAVAGMVAGLVIGLVLAPPPHYGYAPRRGAFRGLLGEQLLFGALTAALQVPILMRYLRVGPGLAAGWVLGTALALWLAWYISLFGGFFALVIVAILFQVTQAPSGPLAGIVAAMPLLVGGAIAGASE